jgi:hypothetical protein
MAEIFYKGKKMFAKAQEITLTGPQAYALAFLWTGLGDSPNKKVLSGLAKLKFIEADAPHLTSLGRRVARELSPLLYEEDKDETGTSGTS